MWIKYTPILTAIFWAICYCSTEQIVKQINISTYLTISALFSFLIYFSILMWNGDYIDVNKQIPYFYIILSSVSSLLASFCSVYAVKTYGASHAAIIEITYPFFCVLITYLVFHENVLSYRFALGGTLIFVGVFICQKS